MGKYPEGNAPNNAFELVVPVMRRKTIPSSLTAVPGGPVQGFEQVQEDFFRDSSFCCSRFHAKYLGQLNAEFPKFFPLKQVFDAPHLNDIAAGTRAAIARLPGAQFIQPGMTVAVGAGSRGISNYDVIVRTVCEELQRF